MTKQDLFLEGARLGARNPVLVDYDEAPRLGYLRRRFREYALVDLAHAVMLAEEGIVGGERSTRLLQGLLEVFDLGPDRFPWDPRSGSYLVQIMPQKKNPHALERVKAMAGQAIGWLPTVMGCQRTVLSTDLDLAFGDDVVTPYGDAVLGGLRLMAEVMRTLIVHEDAMAMSGPGRGLSPRVVLGRRRASTYAAYASARLLPVSYRGSGRGPVPRQATPPCRTGGVGR